MIPRNDARAAGIGLLALLTFCLLACPVIEQPETIFTMRGSLIIASAFSTWTIKKVIAIDDNGTVIGEAVPDTNSPNVVWSMEAAAEENTAGVFWVEMANVSGRLYYNEGTDVMFRPDGYYYLSVNKHYIPVGSVSELARIGTDELYPRNERYTLIRNIRLSGAWKPLCQDGATAFSGVLDGHDFTISGLVLTDSSVWQNIGFFGYVEGSASAAAEIINLNLELANRELGLSAVNEQRFGTLAGYAVNTVIDRVTVNGPAGGVIIRKSGGGDFYAGGITGKMSGEKSKISRSATLFSLELNAGGGGSGYLGGLAGYCESMGNTAGLGGADSVIIEKSYNAGMVVLRKTGGAAAYAGGLIGYHQKAPVAVGNAIIDECYASGNVSVSGGAGTLAAGGLTGGSDPAPGLVITRSCALMDSVTASSDAATPLVSAGALSGDTLAGSSITYQLASVEIKPPPVAPPPPPTFPTAPAAAPPAVNAASLANRSSVDGSWFGSPPLSWDMLDTWRWNATARRLEFWWQ